MGGVTNRITFIGHATVLIDLDGVRILTDPLLRERFLFVRRQVPLPAGEHLEGIDAVVLSHLHPDHLDYPSLRSLDGEPELVVPKNAGELLERKGLTNATELSPGDVARIGEVEVRAVEADHDGRRFPIGRSRDAVGYLISGADTTVYFAGDTDLYDGMAELRGRVDVALLPIGGWGPKVGDGHLDPPRAAKAAAMIEPRIVVPIHWGTYLRPDLVRRRPELLHKYARELEVELGRHAPDVELRALAPGDSLTLLE
jgi:L-ascorbate metabolism protein UlaG (beta-lactamase superfamily)